MKKKILIGCMLVLTLLLLMPSIPAIQQNGVEEGFKQEIKPSEDVPLASPGILYNNLRVFFRGTYGLNMLFVLFGMPTWFFELSFTNENDYAITLRSHWTFIDKKENKVVDEIYWNSTINPDFSCIHFIYTQPNLEHYGFTFGLFDFIVEVEAPEIEADFSVVFHGFLWTKLGCFPFNPWGKLIEE